MTNQQTYTFSAIFQVAKLVQQIARNEVIDENAFTTLLSSTLVTAPDETIEVYGGEISALTLGLETLSEQLGDKAKAKDPEITRYIVSLLALERKLSKKPKVLADLGERLAQAQRQTDHYTITSETLLASLASIYSDVISPIANKIQIAGEPAVLKQTINQHKIRALLLAGVRSAVLWRQLGGKRRNILFSRSKILDCAQGLLKAC